ncbi:MAG: GIY-YIG nuclease family protein [Chloroflexi bacterium]|nr:GIY-YIG nuclease family protein [Chloroflexota bacterium]MBU1747219.1 GIY-YIG nuclease family protein [Chloroflexota bacterium]
MGPPPTGDTSAIGYVVYKDYDPEVRPLLDEAGRPRLFHDYDEAAAECVGWNKPTAVSQSRYDELCREAAWQQNPTRKKTRRLKTVITPDDPVVFIRQVDQAVAERQRRTRPDRGYVYLVQALEIADRRFKIGRGKNPKKRLQGLQSGSPVRLVIALTIPTDHMGRLEKGLHARFAAQRLHGEWFRLSEADVAWCQEHAERWACEAAADDASANDTLASGAPMNDAPPD